jgi:tetratricopeptide (TPR) repeat protein
MSDLKSIGKVDAIRNLVVLAVLAAAIGCGSMDKARQNLVPVALPDLSRSDENVQVQAQQLFATLIQALGDRHKPSAELGAAYGKLGMLLQAGEYYDAAEPCYRNAQTLTPTDVRWPYYLGLLHADRGETERAEGDFKRVLELQRDDVATLIRLGRLYLDEGRPDDAEPLFARALVLAPRTVAALAGLGRTALAKRNYTQAVKHLEEALRLDPEAESLHSPLAIAYRSLGALDKAEPHLRLWRNRDIFVPDPLKQDLDLMLESGLSYELRGVRALEAKDWKTAAGLFRKGMERTQNDALLRRSLQHKLGTALFMAGDAPGAREQFEQVVRLSPPDGIDESAAKAHYSLGVLMISAGDSRKAIEHFTASVKYQPNYVEARLGLADALRQSGRADASLSHYQEAVRMSPRAVRGRLGYAMALVRLRRFQEARDHLAEASRLYPDQPEYAHALARVLATVPDDRVRDGSRAMELVQELFKTDKSTDLGETMAMTLAELGEYQRAAAIQRGVMAAAEKAKVEHAALERMSENLKLYERHQPCRTPWTTDDFAKPSVER